MKAFDGDDGDEEAELVAAEEEVGWTAREVIIALGVVITRLSYQNSMSYDIYHNYRLNTTFI